MVMITYRAEPKIDLAAGRILIDEFQCDPRVDIDLDRPRQLLERHYRVIVETREQIIRDSLIKLGWTPPPDPRLSSTPAPECSDDARLRARADDPSTSVMAADRAAAFAGSHKDRILDALGEHELSTHQVATRAGLTVVQVDRRVVELQREKLIEVLQQDGRDVERLGYRVLRRFRSP